MTPRDVTALILAGGKATRMGGAAKHALVVGGQRILDRQCAVLEPRVSEILVSIGAGTAAAAAKIEGDCANLRVVRDEVADQGPLAGIASGLTAARTPWAIVVACDLPYVTGAIVDLLLERADGDGCAFRIAGRPEPLLCVLHTRVAEVARARVASGQLRASELLTDAGLRLVWLDETAVRAVDPELRALRNINAPADLRDV